MRGRTSDSWSFFLPPDWAAFQCNSRQWKQARDFCTAIPKKCYLLKKCTNRFTRKVVQNSAACRQGKFNPVMTVAFWGAFPCTYNKVTCSITITQRFGTGTEPRYHSKRNVIKVPNNKVIHNIDFCTISTLKSVWLSIPSAFFTSAPQSGALAFLWPK